MNKPDYIRPSKEILDRAINQLKNLGFPKNLFDRGAVTMAILYANGGSMEKERLFNCVQDFWVDFELMKKIEDGSLSIAGSENGELLYQLSKKKEVV